MRSFLLQLVFVALFFTLFFIKPDIIIGFFMAILWLVLALLAWVAGTFLYAKIKGRTPESMGIRVERVGGFEHIWVGGKGMGLPLAISEGARGITVGWATQNYIIIMLATCIFGPGLLLGYVWQPQKFNLFMPLPMLILFLLLWGLACLSFVYTGFRFFFRRPTLLINAQGVTLREGQSNISTLWARDIERISVAEVAYDSDGASTTNYILVANMTGGGREGLCITDRKGQVDTLLMSLRTKGYNTT